jgi:hypothetical protein
MKEFGSLEGLAKHLMTAGLHGVETQVNAALKDAALLLEYEAISEFGKYQEGAGPFGTWPSLAEATKIDRVRKGFSEDEPLLRSGGLRDSSRHEVSATEAIVGNIDPVMEYQEHGTAKIPPRPVYGIALHRHMAALVQLIEQGAYAGLSGAARKTGGVFVADGQTVEHQPGYNGTIS